MRSLRLLASISALLYISVANAQENGGLFISQVDRTQEDHPTPELTVNPFDLPQSRSYYVRYSKSAKQQQPGYVYRPSMGKSKSSKTMYYYATRPTLPHVTKPHYNYNYQYNNRGSKSNKSDKSGSKSAKMQYYLPGAHYVRPLPPPPAPPAATITTTSTTTKATSANNDNEATTTTTAVASKAATETTAAVTTTTEESSNEEEGTLSATKCFSERNELLSAVDRYIQGGCGAEEAKEYDICKGDVAQYGWPIGAWCIGTVDNLSRLFFNRDTFNEDISGWNVENVVDMWGMFIGAREFNQDLSTWDISSVTGMQSMFAGATSFNQDLCAWNDKFPYDSASEIFVNTNCAFQDSPREGEGGPFCASSCGVEMVETTAATTDATEIATSTTMLVTTTSTTAPETTTTSEATTTTTTPATTTASEAAVITEVPSASPTAKSSTEPSSQPTAFPSIVEITTSTSTTSTTVPETTTSTTTSVTTTTTELTTTSTAEETTTTSTAIGTRDCSSDYCESTLTDGYVLRYKINEVEATVSMELAYDGEAWVGIAFSEDARMGGSDGIIGSPDSGIPQKYRLNQGSIEILPPEEQTLTDATVEVVDGQTIMMFTKPLIEPNQIPIISGVNNMLWANGGSSTLIGYHGQNRAPFSLSLSFDSDASAQTTTSATLLEATGTSTTMAKVVTTTAASDSIVEGTPSAATQEPLRITLTYDISNQCGVDAEKVMNEVDNNLKAGLIAATTTVLQQTLNEAASRSIDGFIRFRVVPPRVRGSAVTPQRYKMLPHDGRALAAYSDEYPVTIDRIIDVEQSCEPGSNCLLIISTISVVLEEGEDPNEVKNAVTESILDSFDDGRFNEAVPPDTVVCPMEDMSRIIVRAHNP